MASSIALLASAVGLACDGSASGRRGTAVYDSVYGLQAGVLTHSLQAAFTAHRTLEAGDVPPCARAYPAGGEDYTDVRVMVLSRVSL